MWGKEGLCNIGQKRNEKKRKKKLIFTCVPGNAGNGGGRSWEAGGAKHGGGDYVGERRGYEDPARGIKRVVTLVRKGTKKRKEKKITLLAYPRMRQWWRRELWGLRGKAQWGGLWVER